MPYDLDDIRTRFPALDDPGAFFDAPGGTQVPKRVIDAVARGLAEAASNVGGGFPASQTSEETVAAARAAAADLLGGRPGEVAFGPNMTTLTLAFSRALARDWSPGDRVVVTRLDHDANVTPWVLAAEDRGAEVAFADLRAEDVSLDLEHLESVVDARTRLVAVTGCSNAFGTRVDVARVAEMAHRVGAWCFVDAVHLAPHVRIDVASLGVDALACSAYKLFGPHVGMLWARPELTEGLRPYKVRPAPDSWPGRMETGTPSFALLAGVEAAVDHLASLAGEGDRRARLDASLAALGAHERALTERFLAGLPPNVRLWGRATAEGRVPTFALEVEGMTPQEASSRLAAQGLYAWAGHYYAVEPMARLGLLEGGGLLRIGFVHTTTTDEVDRLLEALRGLGSG